MNTQTVCFIGQRRLPQGCIPDVKRRLAAEVEALAARGADRFLCGGAAGFDTLAGLTVAELRGRYPQVRLVLVLPYRGREAQWFDADRQLLTEADEVVYVSDAYETVCMANRTRYLIEHSGRCIAYCAQKSGAAARDARAANRQGLAVVNLANAEPECAAV